MRADDLREVEWQARVVRWAVDLGWSKFHDLNARGSDPGWPDLVLARVPQLLVAELKTDVGKVRPAQATWLDRLAACGVEVHLWRPRDESLVLRRLSLPPAASPPRDATSWPVAGQRG